MAKTQSWEVSDELWQRVEPLVPKPPARRTRQRYRRRPGGGRKPLGNRQIFAGIVYVLRTGCQWKALDQTELCPGSTAHDRFQEWVQADVFLQLWQAGVAQFDALQWIDWDWLSMDEAMTKAPLGGGKNRPQSH